MAWSRSAAAGGAVPALRGAGSMSFGRRLGRRLLILPVVAALLGIAAAASAGIVRPDLFGSHEIHSANLKAFPQWQDALARFEEELLSCADIDCRAEEWNELIESLQGWDTMTRLTLLNEAINRHAYVEDIANWDELDYWATPLEFLARSGDCEDFAIAKYMALRTLGTAADDLRVVIVRDSVRRIGHAVLAVYVDGRALILDNLRDEVVAADVIRHYDPVYSLNEDGWWLHRR
jgi:predicted transglutaminase-like cysteine proteinase